MKKVELVTGHTVPIGEDLIPHSVQALAGEMFFKNLRFHNRDTCMRLLIDEVERLCATYPELKFAPLVLATCDFIFRRIEAVLGGRLQMGGLN